MSNQLPSIPDLAGFLRENPDIRSQVSTKGAFASALPDALRIKREAIELREKLRQSKASLDHYAASKAASQKQLADAQKTLDAFKQSRRPIPAKPAAPAPSATPLLDELIAMSGAERTAFYTKNERAIRLEILRANSPESITPNL